MNKDMLDRLRSAVREGSRKSAEPRPDKAAVPMTTLVSTPSEAEDRIGPSFYSQADLDAARRAAEQLGYGIGLKPARANPPAVAVRHDELGPCRSGGRRRSTRADYFGRCDVRPRSWRARAPRCSTRHRPERLRRSPRSGARSISSTAIATDTRWTFR